MKIGKLFTRITVLLIFSVLSLNTPVFSETPVTARAKEYIENIPVKVVKKIPLPKGYHEGLFFDGVNIWVCNGRGGKVWIVDPASGAVISGIEPLGPFAEGITNSGDGIFWLTDWETKKLYRFRIEDNGMKAEHEVSFDPAHPAGVAWTGEALYVITWTRSVTGTKYHLIKLDGNGVILSGTVIKGIYEPAHLAWDGKHLWITSWYSSIVYRADIDNLKITGTFKSPADQATGITWDGKYLWITGTSAALYQIEIEKK